MKLFKHNKFSFSVSLFLIVLLLVSLSPLQAFAIPILPPEASQGFVPTGPPARPQPKNVFPSVAASKVELNSRRTANSREFLNPDGTFSLEVTPRPENFKDKAGKWQPIDNQLVATTDKGFAYENRANSFKALFAKNNQSGDLVHVNFDDSHSVAFSPVDKFVNNGIPGNAVIQYQNFILDANLNYIMDYDRLKEEIVLQKYTGKNTFVFNLNSKGLVFEKDAGGNILGKDDKTGQKTFDFVKPYAMDKSEAITNQATLDIQNTSSGSQLVLTVDDKWLQNAQYPVTIDPTITTSIQPGSADSKDTFVSSLYPTSVYNTSSYLHAGYHTTYGTTRSFIQFKYLPSLAAGAQITNAYADLNMYLSISGSDGTVINAHRITSSWQSGSSTWNSQPTYNSTAESSINSTTAGDWDFDLTNLVKSWYNGTASNYGIMLKASNESSPRRSFLSGDASNSQPKLVIQYKVDPLGQESFWGYSGDVNVHNGNLVLSDTDVDLPGKGIPINIVRTYNSRFTSSSSTFGYGWSFNVGMRLGYSDGGTVLFIDGDGTRYYFVKGSDGTYISPAGVYLTLTQGTDGTYTIQEKEGTKYHFNSSGNLDSITDTDGNTTTVSYANGNISSVSDVSGRSVTFNYTNGQLSSITGAQIPTVSYGYDASGNLTSVTKKDASNNILDSTTFGNYDSNHYVQTVTDGENNTTTIDYSNGQVYHVKKQLTINGTMTNLTTTYTYQDTGNGMVTKVANPKGGITQYSTNPQANVTQVIQDYGTGKLNLTTGFTWDQNQNLVKIIYPNAATDPSDYAVMSYDSNGNIVSINDPSNNNSINHFNDKNDVTDSTSFAGRTTVNTYNSANRQLTGAANPLFATNIYRYGSDGNILGETSPLTVDNNMVSNSGFETWGTDPGTGLYLPVPWTKVGTGGTITQESSNKANGSYSAKLVSTGSTDSTRARLLSDYIPVTPLTKYSLSWFVKTQGVGATNGGAAPTVHWYDSNKNWMSGSYNLAAATGTQDWLKKEARVNAPSNAVYARVEVSVNDAGTAWYDNIQMEYGSVINQYNLLDNPSFENYNGTNGIPDNWNQGTLTTGDGITNSTAHTGSRSVLINGALGVNKNFYYEVNLQGQAGTPVDFSGWSKTTGLTAGTGTTYYQVLLTFVHQDGTSDPYGVNITTSSHDWQYVERTVAAPSDFTKIRVYGKVENFTGQAWFDDLGARLDGAPNAIVSDYNIVQNGSFETPNPVSNNTDFSNGPDGWRIYKGTGTFDITWGASSDTVPAYNGSHYVRFANPPDWASVANIPLEPLKQNTTYTASAVIKTDNVGGNGALLKIDIYDSNGVFKTQKISRVLTGTNDWTRVSVSLSDAEAKALNSNAAQIRPSVGTLGASTGTMYFDAVRMSEGGAETTYSYTSDGNYVTSITDPMGNSTNLTPNNRGDVTSATDPLSNTSNFEYDMLDQMTAAENPLGLRTETTYDKNGNVKSVVNKNKSTGVTLNTSSALYNELGLIKSSTDPKGQTTSYQYDMNGNLSSINYPTGEIATYGYDAADRLNSKSYKNDSTTWSFQYDNNGNTTAETKNGSQTTSYQYDKLNRVTSVTFPKVNNVSNTASYQYNPDGQVTSITNSPLSTNPVQFTYDNAGQSVDVYGPNNSQESFVRDEQGRVKKAYEADNNTGMYYNTYSTYDPIGQLIRLRTEDKNGNVVVDYSYTYDQDGNRKTESNLIDGSSVTYTYDAANQLLDETTKDSSGHVTNDISYQYEAAYGGLLGNITKITNNGVATNLRYNAANEITSFGGNSSYNFDQNGNLSFDGQTTYNYDAENHLISVVQGTATIAQYEYNADGLRTKKIANGKTELYYYNGGELAYITDGSNNLRDFFTRDSSGNLINMIDYTGATPNTYWYLYDAHGNIVGLADKNGQVVVTYKYDAWGNIISSTGTATSGDGQLLKDANPFRYSGYQYDSETGFYYIKARYYTPYLRRFISRDAVSGLNLYTYCGNNPVKFVDPEGNYKKGDENLPPDVREEIKVFENLWNIAHDFGDRKAMAQAERGADDIRKAARMMMKKIDQSVIRIDLSSDDFFNGLQAGNAQLAQTMRSYPNPYIQGAGEILDWFSNAGAIYNTGKDVAHIIKPIANKRLKIPSLPSGMPDCRNNKNVYRKRAYS